MRATAVVVRKRLFIILLIGLVSIIILLVRLGYVQFVMGDWLTNLAEDSWSQTVPFEAERGNILDRHGELLATNISAPSVFVVPKQVENREETAKKLAEVLFVSEDKAYDWVTKNERIVRLNPEGRKISKEKAREVHDLELPGVYIAEDNKRHYPKGKYLSHVLGFVGIDNQGLTGIEAYYDEQLQGERGAVSYYADAKGKQMPGLADQYTEPKKGDHLKLTIDDRVQTIIERELDIAEATYNPDGALAIAIDPNNGDILGMSSRPDFHPEEYLETPPEVYNQNKPIWSTYEPGSTFKIITLAAALEEGKVDLEHATFHDHGHVEVGGSRLRCWKKGGHGQQTFLEVVQNSCNPGFVELGERLGKDTLFQYIDAFGFGKKTGIDLQGEGTGILFQPENIGPLELATTSFGQGVSVTPLQQVTAVSAAINGGYLYQPRIAKEWIDSETGQVKETYPPVKKERVISQETSEKVRNALEHVVAKGTGKGAYVDGYRVGGKTGTAQKAKGGRYLENNHIVSFIGFAPADDPQIVVYVAVDNPKDTVQFGGVVAAPIVGTIIEDSLKAMGVKKRTDGLEKEMDWNDQTYIEVPDLISLTLKEVHEAYYPLHVETVGNGDRIVMQSPQPGEKIKEGGTIRLYLRDK